MFKHQPKPKEEKKLSRRYWLHRPTQRIFAVDLEGSTVVAAYGPILSSELLFTDMRSYRRFQENLEDYACPENTVEWINRNKEAFAPYSLSFTTGGG